MTVFGFLPEAQAAIMREFARCGEILSFGSGREDKVNWVHIQFAVCCLRACPVLLTKRIPAVSTQIKLCLPLVPSCLML